MKARRLLLAIMTAISTVCPAQDNPGGGTVSADSVILIKRDTVLTLRCDTFVTLSYDTLTAEALSNLLVQRRLKSDKLYVLSPHVSAILGATTRVTPPVTTPPIATAPVAKAPVAAVPAATAAVATAPADTLADGRVPATTVHKKRISRIDRELEKMTFIPKKTWFGGATISYTEQEYDNLNYLLVKDIKAEGYTFGVSPFVGYFIKKDLAVGLRFTYNRSMLDLQNFDLNLGEDFKINLKDMNYLEHDFQIAGFMRTYMPLGKSKVFGFFSEARLTYGHSQAKIVNGRYEDGTLDGTYSQSDYLHIGFAPGMTAFVRDWMSVEVQMGIMGFNFKWTDQVTNQVEHGSQRSFSGKFDINLFSISIGSTIYL